MFVNINIKIREKNIVALIQMEFYLIRPIQIIGINNILVTNFVIG